MEATEVWFPDEHVINDLLHGDLTAVIDEQIDELADDTGHLGCRLTMILFLSSLVFLTFFSLLSLVYFFWLQHLLHDFLLCLRHVDEEEDDEEDEHEDEDEGHEDEGHDLLGH